MDHEILNEIITITVGSLFEPSSRIALKSRGRSGLASDAVSERQLKSGPKNENPKENPTKNRIEDLLDYWVINEGPKIYQESIRRLKIDLNKVTRKELEKLSYDRLNQEKKKIKIELKNYDLTFKVTFKRFPLKNEKEPMRPLYIYYKTVKEILMKYTQGLKKLGEENLRVDRKEAIIVQNPSSNSLKSNELVKKLVDMKKKRDDLRAKFQKYHSEFWKNNNRKIKYAQDIAPIEQDYKVYKTLKEEIARLEALLN